MKKLIKRCFAHIMVCLLFFVICIGDERTYAASRTESTYTDSGYSYSVEYSDSEPPFWVISTQESTKYTYEWSMIDSRSYKEELSNFRSAVDRVDRYERQLERDYGISVATLVFKVVTLPEWVATKLIMVLCGVGSTAAFKIYKDCNSINENQEECENWFNQIKSSISR